MLGKELRAGGVVTGISPETGIRDWEVPGWLGQAGSELWSPVTRAGFVEPGSIPGESLHRSRSETESVPGSLWLGGVSDV